MNSRLENVEGATTKGDPPGIEIERLRLELEASRKRVVQLDGLIESHKKSEILLQGEKNITEMIARGDELQLILESSCNLVEESLPRSLAIILLLDGKRLRRGAAPSFPKYLAEVDGFEIDPALGTCSAAAARREQVITSDISIDRNWSGHLDLASRHGLKAGWATPLLSSTKEVLGTFGLYWPEPCSPTSEHLQIIDQIARMIAFAIERKRAAEALHASEKLARGQAEALTITLDSLARETDPERIVEHVLRTTTVQLDAESCSVWLKNETSELMDFEFAFEDRQFKAKTEAKLAAVSPSLPVGAILPWQDLRRTRRPVALEDIRQGPDFPCRSYLVERGVVTLLMIPMVISGEAKGVISVRFIRKRTFRPEELDLAQALAHQAMLSIQLARLSVESRHAAVVEERNRLAREIHDTLAHGLTGVIVHLEAARAAMSQKKQGMVSEHVERAGELAREGLREARRSAQSLHPQVLEEKPLALALKDLMGRMTSGMTLRARLTLEGEPRSLPVELETHLLRIGQEVLTNALRHAKASEFSVLLAFSTREVRLILRDNGRGFNPGLKSEGFGLRGMRERAESLGGQFSIESSDGNGTVVAVVLPVPGVSESDT
jgi:signal transduction histidine kinase